MYHYLEIYITNLSKYFIAIFMLFYVIQSLFILFGKNESNISGKYNRQMLLMFFVHFTCFVSICFETGEMDYFYFYIFQQLLLLGIIALFRVIYPDGDRFLINNMCMLLAIGFIILTRLSYDKAVKQFFIVAISIVLCMIIPLLIEKLTFLKNLSWIYAIAGIAALGAVLVLGAVTNGSKLSFTVGGITFQPSEIVKILFVFFIASAYAKANDFLQVILTAIFAGIHIMILVASKDLGSALIFSVVYILLTVISTRNILYCLLGALGGYAACMFAYHFFSHVRVRVQAWQDPWSVIDNAGYQIAQSLFAISSGGLFGMGLFQGEPTHIPFVEADFVFSAIVEELGMVFGFGVLLICLFIFWRIMQLSFKLHDDFSQYVAAGIGITYIFQVFLTVGGGAKFIPMTGITLPFISYGGSSVLSTIVMIFIVEGLERVRISEEVKINEMRMKKNEKKKKRRN